MIVMQAIAIDGGGPGRYWVVHREHSFNGQLNIAASQLLVCPICRKTWASLEILEAGPAWPVAQSCETCAYRDEWIPVPGSLLNEEGWGIIDDSLLMALPEELVRREFQLHIKAFQL